MAASAVAADGANERAAKTKIRRVGGLLAVLGIQSRTIGHELAWGWTPQRQLVSFIFCIFKLSHLFSALI